MCVKVCIHVAECISTAAQFVQCRKLIASLPTCLKDLCRCLYFKNLPHLCLAVADAVYSLAIDPLMQAIIYESGLLVNLLYYMFQYDYTLEEGGVERSNDTNQQETANNLAKCCLQACIRLSSNDPASNENNNNKSDEQDKATTPERDRSVSRSLLAMLTPYLAKKVLHIL